ncbi:MAG: hypothetical protein JSV19_05695 [Phycisphaerales bacterium]|nr:MAG: hypothetical protein JSV19_05695 [Phycisphaerales bacterium]
MAPCNRMLRILHTVPGRAICVQPDGTLYGSRKYAVYRSHDDGNAWTKITAVPRGFTRWMAEHSRMACRLLRHEIRAFRVLSTGRYVAANRESVFHARPGEPTMTQSRIEQGTQPVAPPMSITVGPGDRVLWGEYTGSDRIRREIRMYVSDDAGCTYNEFHRFAAGSIRHVHNLYYDRGLDQYWVLVGDHDEEPGIGRLSADLEHFEWVVKGKQIFRAVCVLDFGDRLVYGTDTEMEPNAVMSLDKKTGRVERIFETNGSCIYACRFGGWYALTTTVEPSTVNLSRNATLWLSRDGDRWLAAFEAPMDRWSGKYFQFSSLVLPCDGSDREVIAFSGQAVRDVDGKLIVAELAGQGDVLDPAQHHRHRGEGSKET